MITSKRLRDITGGTLLFLAAEWRERCDPAAYYGFAKR